MNLTLLAFRNALHNKARLLMTLMGIAITVMTFLTLETALGSWDSALELARRDRLVTRHKVSFVLPLPKRYVEEIRSVQDADGQPLVTHTTFASWFGGRVPGREREFFATYAVDAATYAEVHDEMVIDPAALDAFKTDRRAAIVDELLAKQFGWKPGDTVTLESAIYPAPDGVPWTFTIAGIYGTKSNAFGRQTLLFHWDRLNEALPPAEKDKVGWIVSRTRGDKAAEAASVLDTFFEEREVQTLSQDERAFSTGFLGMVSAVLDVVGVLAAVILIIMALILANTMGMSVRERTSELAAMKAVGFSPRHIAYLVLAEAAALAAVGAAIGLVAGLFAIDFGIGSFFEQNLSSFFPIFRVELGPALFAFTISIAAALAAAALPAFSASRLHVTEALRRVA
ncbi:MAG: ABC transporter permease [Polyangiaceae bacterium]|nr:ABC transporter permease [Polyangiaceae bacterium]